VPIYEYLCQECGREFQYLILKKDDEKTLTCPECSGRTLKRLVSRVAYHVSEQDRLAAFDPSAPKEDAFYKDTRNIGLHAKKGLALRRSWTGCAQTPERFLMMLNRFVLLYVAYP